MGLIIKKDNGKYAVWSTICDNFLMDDVTKDELIKQLSEWAKEESVTNLQRQFDNNLYIYTDYEDRCKTRDEIHKKHN